MSCNCKKIKKIQNISHNANHMNNERKGIVKWLYNVLGSFSNFAVKLGVVALLLISLPIVFVVLAFNILNSGKATIQLPKKTVKALINYDKKRFGNDE